jgi:hypothetical protein
MLTEKHSCVPSRILTRPILTTISQFRYEGDGPGISL